MARGTEQSRQERILDAAEHVFAESGFAGASLRSIVRQAKVNLATVYYYFGSKDGLMEAVFHRRFGPLRHEQLEMLQREQQAAKGRALSVEKVLEAMLLPSLRLASSTPEQRAPVARLIGRIVSDPDGRTQQLLHRQRRELRDAFLKALQASLPRMPMADLRWRLEFVWGALAFVMCNPHKIRQETGGVCDPADTAKVLSEMIAFFAPGFRPRESAR
jgi:AcrR family transcriptional regulator